MISDDTAAKLEEAKVAVGEWIDRRTDEVDRQAAFLKRTDTSVHALTAEPAASASADAAALLTQILGASALAGD